MTLANAVNEPAAYDSLDIPVYIRKSRLSVLDNLSYWCHWHDDVEFVYLITGKMSYNVNGTIYRMEAGDGIFVNSQHLHYGYSEDGSDSDYVCIILSHLLLCTNSYVEKRFLTPLISNAGFPAVVLRRDVPWMAEVLDLLHGAYEAYAREGEDAILKIQSIYYRVWDLLFRNQPAETALQDSGRPGLSALKDMLTFIQDNSTQKLTLAQIAAAGNVCESNCCRLFRKYLDRSPVECLTDYRLDQARILLQDTTLPMTEIANRTGFSGASYFAEMFRRKYHCSPSQFRKRREG